MEGRDEPGYGAKASIADAGGRAAHVLMMVVVAVMLVVVIVAVMRLDPLGFGITVHQRLEDLARGSSWSEACAARNPARRANTSGCIARSS